MGKLPYKECENCKDWNGNMANCMEICRYPIDALEEFDEYRKIGTVDECRAAMEKQIAKKPEYEGDGYADGYPVIDTWICPNCGEHYEIECDHYKCCPNCGQRIQHEYWESE